MNLDLGWHTWRKHESVRLAGIDTPEWGKPGASEATAFTAGCRRQLDEYGWSLERIILSDERARRGRAGEGGARAGILRGKREP